MKFNGSVSRERVGDKVSIVIKANGESLSIPYFAGKQFASSIFSILDDGCGGTYFTYDDPGPLLLDYERMKTEYEAMARDIGGVRSELSQIKANEAWKVKEREKKLKQTGIRED